MSSPKRDFGPTFFEMASGRERKRPPISARVRRAIELMTFGFDGGARVLDMREAAAEAKITLTGLREPVEEAERAGVVGGAA